MTTKRINNMDSRFRGNDDNFVARIERSEIREQTVILPPISPDFASLYPGYRINRGCING